MTNFPLYNPGGGAYFDNTFSGDPAWDSNMYILKFSNTTQRLWATLYGGSGWHARPGCTVCSLDNLYVTSSTDAADHPVLDKPGSYFQPNSAGGKDGHMGEFTSAGVLTWSTYVGGFNTDEELNCLAALDGPCGGQVFEIGRAHV